MAWPRKVVAIMAVMSVFPCTDLVRSASAATPEQRAQLKQRVSDSQTPEQARRIVAGLGARRQVAVTLISGATLRGKVGEIGDDHFVLLLDRTATPAEIAYSQVQQVGSGSDRGKHILLGIAVAAAVAMVTVLGVKKAHRWPKGTPGV